MKRSRFTEEQIIGILKEHEAGVSVADLCRKHGVEFESVSFRGVRGKGLRTLLFGPYALAAACIESLRIIRRQLADLTRRAEPAPHITGDAP